jgi:hypothetical protein
MKNVTLNFLFLALLLCVSGVRIKMNDGQVDISVNKKMEDFMEEIENILGKIDKFEGEREKNGIIIDDKEWDISVDPFNDSRNKTVVIDYDEDGDIDEDDLKYHKEYLQELEELKIEEAEELAEQAEELDEEEEELEDEEEEKEESEVKSTDLPKEKTEEEIKLEEEAQKAKDNGKNFSIIINNTTYYLTDKVEKTPISEILEIGKSEAQKIITQFPELSELKKNISTLTSSLGEYVTNLTNRYQIYNKQNEHEINKINLIILQQLQTQLEAELIDIQKGIKAENLKIELYNIELEKYTNQLPQKNSICNMLTSCGSCVANPYCGWCSSTNQCVEGDEHSSIYGQCPFYDYNKCSENSNCEYNSCKECLADAGCGWCNNVNSVCLKKNEAESGLCRINLFYHVWRTDRNNKCPEVNIYNFLDYVDNKLEESSDAYIPEDVVPIEIPKKEDVIDKIERINEEKTNSTLLIDAFLKGYEGTMKQLKDVQTEEVKINVMCGWNETIQKEGKIVLI